MVIMSVLYLVSCAGNTEQSSKNTVIETATVAKAEVVKDEKKEKDMKLNTLESYFSDLPFEMYENCHVEKGASEDFYAGKVIPTEVASSNRLYKIAGIPKLGMKRKAQSEDVEFRAIGKWKSGEKSVLIYTIGINNMTEIEQESFGYETRALVMNGGEIESNYYVGGHKSTPAGMESVCRTAEIKGGKLVLTLNGEASQDVPSILRLDKVEERDI